MKEYLENRIKELNQERDVLIKYNLTNSKVDSLIFGKINELEKAHNFLNQLEKQSCQK